MSDQTVLEDLVNQVCANQKYANIEKNLVRSIGAAELAKRNSLKEAIKSTRNKLHQVGSAYQEKPIPYSRWLEELNVLPSNLQNSTVQDALCKYMQAHSSTSERLSIHKTLFQETLKNLAPITSILDLACGLNPLNLPWMPVAENVTYYACDIYEDMVEFLNSFFAHFSIRGNAFSCNLVEQIPQQHVQLCLLLKTIPCLEQIDKSIGKSILESINAENILVTFPAHSLGGRSKGMVKNYEAHFTELTQGKNWQITRFEFPGELAFLIQK